MATAVDHLSVTTLTENYVDMLLPDLPRVERLGLIHHFDPRRTTPWAENGISFLVQTERQGRRQAVLFDAGLTSGVLLNNFEAVGASPHELSAIVLSHGHPDHFGGLDGLLNAREHPLPVLVHPAAFWPRYLRLPTGEVAPHYNLQLSQDAIERRGGVVTPNEGAVEVVEGVFATGEIPRTIDYEMTGGQGSLDPGLFQLIDGSIAPDIVPDDQALVINVRKLGLVVLTGCSHAGVINTVESARTVTGVSNVHAVMGGFHLGFPGIPDAKTDRTIAAMRELGVAVVAPMHCTGFRATMRFAQEMPDAFLLNVAGTTVTFEP